MIPTKRLANICNYGVLCLLVFTAELSAQRGGPPRRMENPETIKLEGGSRVEFKEFFSTQLQDKIRYSVFLPPSYDRDSSRAFPVVYFLHGLNNDDTSWCTERYGNIPLQITEMMASGIIPEFLMVHPQGRNSFYTDSINGGGRFESYLRVDLIREIESSFRVRRDRSGRSIGGTSMGGYGALKLAMKNPELFATVVAGSPIVLLGDDPIAQWNGEPSRFSQYFSGLFAQIHGEPLDADHWKQNSLEEIAKTAELKDIRIRMLYGTADRYNGRIPVEKGIRRLQEILENRSVSAELKIYEGEPHGWGLLVNHLEESLQFLAGTF